MATRTAAFGEHRMISIGDRPISVYCDGEPGRLPTVILIPAGGSLASQRSGMQDGGLRNPLQPSIGHDADRCAVAAGKLTLLPRSGSTGRTTDSEYLF